ncbi:MAG: recombinase RecA [Silvanigrellales bacterium]|nr:recombinase RecA [Silvanigrellales bacterium]
MAEKSDRASEKSDANKAKAIEAAFLAIEKQFGKGSIMRMSESERQAREVETLSTGALSLDLALGAGGLPRGRIVEVYGTESSGKTTLTLHTIAECQKAGGVAAFIDAEHALDVSYARRIGVNTADLLVSQPDYGEQALEIVDMLVRSGGVDLIVIDSVAALVPKAEIEGEMGDSHVGLHARLMSQALRKLTGSVSKSNCIVVFINQIRMKIGVMFGNPETTTGGQALKFYSSVRLEVRRAAAIKTGTDTVGNRCRVKVVKNKIAAPFKEAEFDVMFGAGISKEGDVLDLAAEADVVQKSGTWFTYNTERLGQGRENAKEYLREHPATLKKIEAEVRKAAALLKDADSFGTKSAPQDSEKELPAAAAPGTPLTAVVSDAKAGATTSGAKASPAPLPAAAASKDAKADAKSPARKGGSAEA